MMLQTLLEYLLRSINTQTHETHQTTTNLRKRLRFLIPFQMEKYLVHWLLLDLQQRPT